MSKRRCQQCKHRLPYASARCTRCGWRHGGPVDAALARGHQLRRQGVLLVVALLLAVGGGLAVRNATVVADWYAGFAARYLPGPMSAFAPTYTDQGAFFFCARQVSREMDGDFSVETFPSPEQSLVERLADGRYRIVSWVDEAPEQGGNVRHGFECTVRLNGGRWALDGLRLEQYASDGTPPAFARAN